MAELAALMPCSSRIARVLATTATLVPRAAPEKRGRKTRKRPAPLGTEPLSRPRESTPYRVAPMPQPQEWEDLGLGAAAAEPSLLDLQVAIGCTASRAGWCRCRLLDRPM